MVPLRFQAVVNHDLTAGLAPFRPELGTLWCLLRTLRMRLFTLFAIVLLAHALPLVSIGKFRKSTFFLGGLGYTCRNLAVAAALALATVPGGAMEAAIAQSATVPALAPVDYYRLSVEADHALHSGQLAQAAQLFTRLLVDHPGNGDYWEKLGTCYERLKQFPDAANAYEHAFSLAVGSRAYIENQIAEMWGDAGERAKVLEWLKRANADAFAHRSEILSDPAFAKWRDDPEFVAVAGQTRPPNLSRDQQWQFDLDYLLAEIAGSTTAIAGTNCPQASPRQRQAFAHRSQISPTGRSSSGCSGCSHSSTTDIAWFTSFSATTSSSGCQSTSTFSRMGCT